VIAPVAPPYAWPYRGSYPRRCRVIGRRRPRRERPDLALRPGLYILAGRLPYCRPACVYRVVEVTAWMVRAAVVYSPGSKALVGKPVIWPRVAIEASWRFGDVRVVARWQSPTETLRQSLMRRMLDEDGAPATGQAAIGAGG
jgi:hypothetical protein